MYNSDIDVSSDKRWGCGERADTESARERLLDAARFCFERLSIAKTSMADIAAQARVTRPTVYSYFPTRQLVINAVIQRELDRFWQHCQRELAAVPEFSDYIVELVVIFLRTARDPGRFRLLFAPAQLTNLQMMLGASMNSASAVAHPICTYALRPGARPPPELPAAIEWFTRIVISLLHQPIGTNEDELRTYISSVCPWTAERLVGGGPRISDVTM